ncbi:hypothetical protein [Candidatus Ichthyocystis hellenicum]|uniref:hypothetical protein n=1 Tax=Candidatus Ichthyocystis hellenicum TaxID=1561003 RepID=UPI000B822D67|nr:hypothetical protein [Candidatus Ichthyocystis hellenicum]
MCYTNSKYLDFSQDGSLEFQHDKEVVEEAECTTVIVAKQESQKNYRSTRSSISRSLTSGFATPLAILSVLSTLKGAEGSNTSSLESYYCALKSSICRLISINSTEVDVAGEIGIAIVHSEAETRSSFINHSLPLVIVNDGQNVEGIENQIRSMIDYISTASAGIIGFAHYLGLNLEVDPNYYTFCHENTPKLCNENPGQMRNITDECCRSVGNYISESIVSSPHVFENLTTVAPEVVNSTTVVSEVMNSTTMASEIINSTSTNSTTLIPTEIVPASEDHTIFIVMLVAILSFAVAVLSFVGYRQCSNKKTHQPVPTISDQINEEESDLV